VRISFGQIFGHLPEDVKKKLQLVIKTASIAAPLAGQIALLDLIEKFNHIENEYSTINDNLNNSDNSNNIGNNIDNHHNHNNNQHYRMLDGTYLNTIPRNIIDNNNNYNINNTFKLIEQSQTPIFSRNYWNWLLNFATLQKTNASSKYSQQASKLETLFDSLGPEVAKAMKDLDLSWSGASDIRSEMAMEIKKNVETHLMSNYFKIQKERIEEKMKKKLFGLEENSLSHKKLKSLVNSIAFFVRSPANFNDQGSYGFTGALSFVDRIINDEFRDTKDILSGFKYFGPKSVKFRVSQVLRYLHSRLQEIEENKKGMIYHYSAQTAFSASSSAIDSSYVFEDSVPYSAAASTASSSNNSSSSSNNSSASSTSASTSSAKKKKKKNKNIQKRPYFGKTSGFTLLPMPTYTRRCVRFSPSAFTKLMTFINSNFSF